MVKRGDFVECTATLYSITNMDTICLVINDSDSCDSLSSNSISVMVVEDYSKNRGFKGIGSIYVVKKNHFRKIDYRDIYKEERKRTHKMIMKLANSGQSLTREKISEYASKRQIATHFSSRSGNLFYYSFVEDCVLKVYEINLDVVTDKPKQILLHEINCLDITGTFDYGELRNVEQLLQKNYRNVKTTTLFQKNMFIPIR